MEGMVSQSSYWQRTARRAFNRRRFVGTVAVAGSAAWLAACGGDGDDSSSGSQSINEQRGSAPTAAAGQEPKAGGELRQGFTGPFAGVDPHNSVYGGAGIVAIVYSYLIRKSLLSPERGIVQELATSQEQSPDGLSTVFKIRPNVMIAQNNLGVPVRAIDAEDVKLSFERVGNPATASSGFGWISEWVDRFEAVDSSTFRITTKQPYAWMLDNSANNLTSAIVPREWIASPNIKQNAVGSGPFTLQSVEEGGQAVLARNPTYWESGRPYLATNTIRAFADQSTYRTAFSSSQLDTYGAFDLDEAKELERTRRNVQLVEGPTLAGLKSFWMNVRMAPWNDPRIRKAVRLATNPQEYIGIIGRGQGVQTGPISYALAQYALPEDEAKRLQPFNVQEARQLLQAAGQPNLTFKFQHPTSSNTNDYVNIFVRQMQAAGITAQPEPQDAGTWVANYFQSKLTASLSLNQEYATPEFFLKWYTTKGIVGAGLYDTGFSDPEVDAAVKKASGTMDEQERIKAYQDAQRLVISKDPAVWYFFGVKANTLIDNAVIDYPAGTGDSLAYGLRKDVWLNR